MSKALDGVKILDFTHVQSGPTCTQLLAWMGADVIKVEKAGEGDATRGQLRDIPDVDSLYFTMLNHNKRSITLDTKNPKGKEVLVTLIKQCDVLVENFAPGALDRMGFSWERIQEINPRMIVASVKGFGPGPVRGLQGVRERRAMRRRLGFDHRLRRRPAAGDRRADRRQRHRRAPGAGHRRRALPAQHHGPRPARAGRHAGRRAQPVPRQAARPAAPGTHRRDDGVPAVPGHRLRRSRAARGQCIGRRPAGLDPQVQGLAEGSERLHLLHHAGAGVGRHLQGDRRGRLDHRPALRHTEGPPAAPEVDLRADRGMDHDQGQVRGHGHPEQVRHPLRPDPLDEGDRRGAVAARHRHRGRSRPSHARQVPERWATRSRCRTASPK